MTQKYINKSLGT